MTRAWLLGVLVWLLLLQVPGASAKSLAVQKAVLGAPQAGDELTIYLNLSNPFSENIVVKLRDDNDVGGVHLVTDCALADGGSFTVVIVRLTVAAALVSKPSFVVKLKLSVPL